jgi:hypothetical protein
MAAVTLRDVFSEVAVGSVERSEWATGSAPWKVRLLSLRRRFIPAAQAHRSCFRRICIALPTLVNQRANLIFIDTRECIHLSRR